MMTTTTATTQTTFATYDACFRCGGFRNAFAKHTHIVAGKCLRCAGGLRESTTRPVSQLATYRQPGSRATHIAVIARVLEDIAAPSGESPWNWPTRREDDNAKLLAAMLSQADADVRARGYAAVVSRIAQTMSTDAAARELRLLHTAISEATGIPAHDVKAWARSKR